MTGIKLKNRKTLIYLAVGHAGFDLCESPISQQMEKKMNSIFWKLIAVTSLTASIYFVSTDTPTKTTEEVSVSNVSAECPTGFRREGDYCVRILD